MGFASVGGWAGGGEVGSLAGQDVTAKSFTATAATADFVSNATDGNFGFVFGAAAATGIARSTSNHKMLMYANNTLMLTLDSDNSVVDTALTFKSSIASGSDAYKATVNGARWHFGAGANDYCSSDGTTVTFAGSIATTSITTSSSATIANNTLTMSGSSSDIYFSSSAATAGRIYSHMAAANATATNPAVVITVDQVLDATDAVFGVKSVNEGANLFLVDYSGRATVAADISLSSFTDDSANTGSRTVNSVRGISAFAGASATITITNSFVTATSTVLAVVQTNDATAILKNVVPASGSFAINLNANATGTTKVSWVVIN